MNWGDILKNIIMSKRGEGYTDVVVIVLVTIMVIMLAISSISLIIQKINLDHYAHELMRTAEISGQISAEVDNRYSKLKGQTGISPSMNWQASYFSSYDKKVQLKGDITLYLELQTSFKGFGGFLSIPITLKSKATGQSEKYWK